MDSTTAVTWASFFIALVAGGGFTLQQQRVAALRSDLIDSSKRVEGLRGDLLDAERERVDDRTRIAQLESDLRHSEQMATGAAHWKALDEHLDNHHRESMKAWAGIKTEIHKLQSKP